jgi:hypothetical protein
MWRRLRSATLRRGFAPDPMRVCVIEAVNRWRCRPCLLNHEPFEMETQISVSGSLFGE